MADQRSTQIAVFPSRKIGAVVIELISVGVPIIVTSRFTHIVAGWLRLRILLATPPNWNHLADAFIWGFPDRTIERR